MEIPALAICPAWCGRLWSPLQLQVIKWGGGLTPPTQSLS